MAKKTKKDKEIAKLRREVEALRAQARGVPKFVEPQSETGTAPAVTDVRADLRKTALLTVVCLGILLLLSLTQSRWSSF